MKNRKHRLKSTFPSKYNTPYHPAIQREIDKLSPKRLWEVCRPLPVLLEMMSKEEQILKIQDSRIVVFGILSRRSELNSLVLHGDTLHPLGLKLDYSIPQQSNHRQESYY